MREIAWGNMMSLNIKGILYSILGVLVGVVVTFIGWSVALPIIATNQASLEGNMTSGFASFFTAGGIVTLIIELIPLVVIVGLAVAGYQMGKKD